MTFPARLRRPALTLLGAGVLALSSAPSYAYSALYVFGDSLSDVGNVYTATGGTIPASPYAGGRFSNGPVWAEDLSASLKLGALTPSLRGGTDYAFGDATASAAVPGSDPLIPNVGQQVGAYTVSHGVKADASALYAVWIGANDVLNALEGLAGGTLTLAQAQVDLAKSAKAEVNALTALVNIGARHLLVGLVPDIGLTPQLNTTAPQLATALSAYYNQQLVTATNAAIPHGDLAYLNAFKLLDDVIANPPGYNFSNVTSACFEGSFAGGGTTCSDPNDYLFWDAVHPTAAAHKIIADIAREAVSGGVVSPVPLPGTAPLFSAALVMLGAFAVFRRHGARQAV